MLKSKASEAILDRASRFQKGTRAAIDRLVVIYQALQNSRRVNCSSLAELTETSPRTIARDIEFLRDRLQLPIEYRPEAHTFVFVREGGAR